jgi:O-antigen ligase
VLALLVSFAPLLVFQALSVLFHVPKSTEGTGGESYIGGYYHEGGFSTAVLALIVVFALSRSISGRLKLIAIPILIVSILLANYRTAILACLPLIGFYALYAISRPVDPRLRGMVVLLVGFSLIVVGGLSLMTLDRFKDLQTVIEHGTSLIKPVDQFGATDRELLSGRFQIWSEYYYTWKAGSQLHHLIGFGPDSWEGLFDLYAHNTFVDYLFEYGFIGLAALIVLFGSGLLMALRAQQERWKLVAAHLSFLILNLATMPLWLIEGNIVFGLLWGYTLYYGRSGITVSVKERPRPQLKAVSI